MRALRHPVFIIAVILFITHQVVQKAGIAIPFLHSYLDDLLCMPVVLTLSLVFMRALKRKPGYRLKVPLVIFTVAYVAVFFEVLLPRMNARYHGDAWDLLAYLAGAALWWFTVNRETQKDN